MTEYISLELAQRIAEGYRVLGVEAPKARYGWYLDGSIKEPFLLPVNVFHEPCLIFIAYAYTAAEIIDALPVGTKIEKLSDRFFCSAPVGRPIYHMEFADAGISDGLAESLGLMLERVLNEMRREKGVDCPICGGTGEFILSPGGSDMEGEHCEPPTTEQCENCGGTGKINQGGAR